jgi:hypothetical protein
MMDKAPKARHHINSFTFRGFDFPEECNFHDMRRIVYWIFTDSPLSRSILSHIKDALPLLTYDKGDFSLKNYIIKFLNLYVDYVLCLKLLNNKHISLML